MLVGEALQGTGLDLCFVRRRPRGRIAGETLVQLDRHQRPLVRVGKRVECGDVLGCGSDKGTGCESLFGIDHTSIMSHRYRKETCLLRRRDQPLVASPLP